MLWLALEDKPVPRPLPPWSDLQARRYTDAVSAPSTSRWPAVLLGAYPLAGGLLTLLGWARDWPRLTDWFGTGISMQPNTAIAAACAGLAVMIGARWGWAMAPFALVTVVIGAATFSEHLTGIDLGIDTLVLHKLWGHAATTSPGRMGPPASMSYTLIGTGLLLLLGRRGGRARSIAAGLGLAGVVIAFLALTGYLLGSGMLYALPRFTGIALQTASILLSLGLALVFSVPEHQPMKALWEDSAAGMLARRGLPIILVLPMAIGWVTVQAQTVGLYDGPMGTSLLVLVLTVLMCGVLWWGVSAVGVRERAMAAMNEVTSRADMVLRSARDQVVVLDKDWRYTYVNDQVFEVTGQPRERFLGHTLWDVFPGIRGGELETVARRVMERRESEAFEQYYEPWDRWFDTRISPTADGGIAFFMREITDRKRAEKALRDADVRKDEFLATLAHELRGPLAPVRNWLEIMKRDGNNPDLVQQARASMDRQLGQMVRLIDDLLDVSRITRNRLELHTQRVVLKPVIDQALEASAPLAKEKRLQVSVEIPAEPIVLEADPVRMVQIFDNLLTNACKFTRPGGTIRVAAARSGDEAVVTVQDDGAGIAPDMLPRIFEMFTKTDPPAGVPQSGLGLGLALVKRLVELHHGTIRARSEGQEKGSTFEVRLPALKEAPPLPPSEAVGDFQALKGRRFLVVDDHPDSADSLAMLLSLNGIETQTANDGAEAVVKAGSFRPHVILLDIGLPRMNGYEACAAIRREPWGADMVIVALTGWGQDQDRRKSHAAGFDHHLVKPVQLPALSRLLAELLASERA
jgi:PAS domain S-box-containing protein